jgi:hypothetical protein
MSHDNFIKFKGEQYQYEISKKLERSSSSGSLYGSFFLVVTLTQEVSC